jgi:hypothetical protein
VPTSPETADPYNVSVFRPVRNVVHGTGGLGVTLRQLEINAAVDLSSRTNTVSVSTVVRF